MTKAKKVKCIRCETLERPQKRGPITFIKNAVGESIPLCSACILEIKEEEDFFRRSIQEEEDESGSESLDIEFS